MTLSTNVHTDTFQIERRTDNAIKLTHLETGVVDWVPLSQVEEIHEQPNGTVLVTMQKWIARKKGFCDE